jgi:DNA mismatch repair protein MutH
LERDEALEKLRQLVGVDLSQLAAQYPNVTLGRNKGWAGHLCEAYLGLKINSSREPNGGSWELKQVSLKRTRDGLLTAKETMAITLITPQRVLDHEFETSDLLKKLRRLILVARVFVPGSTNAEVLIVREADISVEVPLIYNQVRADYEETRETIRTLGFSALSGRMGKLVQPRTKGAGHGSISRAFYARTQFVNILLGLNK